MRGGPASGLGDRPRDGAGGAGSPRVHLLTVVVEDYFQHRGFSDLIPPDRWRRFEARVEQNTSRALALLDEFGIRATFFTLGWIAERMPEVVREVRRRGHEVASKGYQHRSIQEMGPAGFREDLVRSREVIEAATGCRVHGYRVAEGSFTMDDLWALDVLAEEGFSYDSSIYPHLWCFASEPWRRFPHVHRFRDRELHELPLSSFGPGWMALPAAGGNYFRQLPDALVRQMVARWDRSTPAPFNLYFHVWELDPDLPRIEAVGWLTRMRQYRNLHLMPDRLRYYFRTYRFQSIADRLGLRPDEPVPAQDVPARRRPPAVEVRSRGTKASSSPTSRQAVTVVVPVFNEELAIPYLANTLAEVTEELSRRHDLSFIFVDDGSSDGTWEALHRHFGGWPACEFVRHDRNQGVAAAILTGIRHARTEVVCSIDCDCTYDPRQLADMIARLGDDVAMVTASPYHPDGRVLNVPAWRLSLSKGLSFLYRRVMHNKLSTYTACFRVYRRSAVEGIRLTRGGFLGVAEMLGRLDLAGARVVEHPAVLEVRMLGYSKMKVLKTIRGHLGLLAGLAAERVRVEVLGREPS